MVQALQSVGEERLVDLALCEEHSKDASQVSLMLKYGVTRNRLSIRSSQEQAGLEDCNINKLSRRR